MPSLGNDERRPALAEADAGRGGAGRGGAQYVSMGIAQKISSKLADTENPASFSAKARQRRWDTFTQRFPRLAGMKVLDLGGAAGFWERAPIRPVSVTVVNLEEVRPRVDWITAIRGDACEWDQGGFDLVVSNSVLEHVGGHAKRRQLADVILASGEHHWVQTPYRYFPIEPHFVFPGLQFLPVAARAKIAARWPLGVQFTGDVLEEVQQIELIGLREMRSYFPGEIWIERVGGLPKSLVAVG